MTEELRDLLAQAQFGLDYGEYRGAREVFDQIRMTAQAPDLLRQAAVGSARASQRLSDMAGILAALDDPRLPAKTHWPTADAVEAALLMARARKALGEDAGALADVRDATRSAAAALGLVGEAALSAQDVARIVEAHPDVAGVERLVNTAMAMAELHAGMHDVAAGAEWLKAAATVFHRTLSFRDLSLMGRIQVVAGMLDQIAQDSGLGDEIVDTIPLEEIVSKVWAMREKAAALAGQSPPDPAAALSDIDESLAALTPAAAVESLAQLHIDENLMSSGQGDVILGDIANAISEYKALGAVHLTAIAQFQLARLLCERGTVLAMRAFKDRPFAEQQADRDANKHLRPEIDARVEPLLIDATASFNRDRPDYDTLLLAGLILFADVAALRGDDDAAEALLHFAIAITPSEPAGAWRACVSLSDLLVKRGALATGAFWAKCALLGVGLATEFMSVAFSSPEIGGSLAGQHLEQLLNLLRRMGRIQEAASTAQIVTQGGAGEGIPWSAREEQARALLLKSFAAFAPRAPFDFNDDGTVHGYFHEIECLLEAPEAEADFTFVPPPGVALLSIAPNADGVSLRLETGGSNWAQEIKSTFPKRYPLAFAVDSLFENFSQPPEKPDAAWPSDIFAKSWIEQVSTDIVGAVPALQAHTLVLRTDGVFRFLPFAPLGVNGPLVEHHCLLVCPRHPVRRAPMSRAPRVAILALTTSNLHGIGGEIDLLGRLAGPARTIVKDGGNATAQALRDMVTGDNTLLHIATHCVSHPAEPALSRLQLGDGTTITLAELSSRDLSRFELVTLAACASGRPGGASHMTPADLLHQAGAQRVLTSLWEVDDCATSILMRQFYEALLGKEPLAPAAALRHAQLRIRAIYPHPYFWAGFYLSGVPD